MDFGSSALSLVWQKKRYVNSKKKRNSISATIVVDNGNVVVYLGVIDARMAYGTGLQPVTIQVLVAKFTATTAMLLFAQYVKKKLYVKNTSSSFYSDRKRISKH